MHSCLQIMLCLVAFCGNAAATSLRESSSNDQDVKCQDHVDEKESFDEFKSKYGKQYKDEAEEKRRMEIFEKNMVVVVTHNLRYTKGESGFEMGMNPYTDMEILEFLAAMTGYKHPNSSDEPKHKRQEQGIEQQAASGSSVADAFDWRNWQNKSCVTPVKNQGIPNSCGSCWAFSTTGALEGQHCRITGKLVSLSEQQLLDGCKENFGCDGGYPAKAISYVSENKGIDTEESYPYEGKVGADRYNSATVGTTCDGVERVAPNEEALKVAVATLGPVSICIDASLQTFKEYKDGIYDDPQCNTVVNNHAVLVVGYGADSSGKQYWIVKNSWGTEWGMGGYIHIARNKPNMCGITNEAVYPRA